MTVQISLTQALAAELRDILTKHKKQINDLLDEKIDKLKDENQKSAFTEADADMAYTLGKMSAKAEAIKDLLDEAGLDHKKCHLSLQ
tara:strand:+ start:56 stop:316 length:261 start_codon:yes stop_codon:yes gene_type:complete